MQFPPKLKDLLVREAHLNLARESIDPILADKEAELKAVEASKPGLFAARDRKEDYRRRHEEVMATVKLLREGVAQLDRVGPHLRRMVEEETESLLRSTDPAYVAALAARQHRQDWDRCLGRFAEKVFAFTRSLGNARNLACSGYNRETHAYSQAAVQGFILAIGAGKKAEDEVKFANKVSDVQANEFKASGLAATALPKLPQVAYSQWVAMIGAMPLAEAQQQFDKLIVETKQLYESGIPSLRGQAEQATARQEADIHGFLDRKLLELRAAVRPEINPEETERSVADSERMLNELARKSVLGRLPGA